MMNRISKLEERMAKLEQTNDDINQVLIETSGRNIREVECMKKTLSNDIELRNSRDIEKLEVLIDLRKRVESLESQNQELHPLSIDLQKEVVDHLERVIKARKAHEKYWGGVHEAHKTEQPKTVKDLPNIWSDLRKSYDAEWKQACEDLLNYFDSSNQEQPKHYDRNGNELMVGDEVIWPLQNIFKIWKIESFDVVFNRPNAVIRNDEIAEVASIETKLLQLYKRSNHNPPTHLDRNGTEIKVGDTVLYCDLTRFNGEILIDRFERLGKSNTYLIVDGNGVGIPFEPCTVILYKRGDAR